MPAQVSFDVAYGAHPAQKLDFYPVETSGPTPVVVYFHGGGFFAGDKADIRRNSVIRHLHHAGIGFAAVNYRLVSSKSTIPDALHDCARAVQFLRSKAADWNVDPRKIAAFGESCGASAALWLAFHDDMADPTNRDPVLRHSTRLACAASISGQFSLDLAQWSTLFPPQIIEQHGRPYLDPRLWGLRSVDEFTQPAGRRLLAEFDIVSFISSEDPPVFLEAHRPDRVRTANEFLHHPKLSLALREQCVAKGVSVVASIPAFRIKPGLGEPGAARVFLVQQLTGRQP